MKKKSIEDIEKIAEQAQKGRDVSKYFTGRHIAKQLISIDFPLRLLRLIDEECAILGITRQEWMQSACDEKLKERRARRKTYKVS